MPTQEFKFANFKLAVIQKYKAKQDVRVGGLGYNSRYMSRFPDVRRHLSCKTRHTSFLNELMLVICCYDTKNMSLYTQWRKLSNQIVMAISNFLSLFHVERTIPLSQF